MTRLSSKMEMPPDAVAVMVYRDSAVYFGYVRAIDGHGHLPRAAVLEIWDSRFVRKWVSPNGDKDIDVLARAGFGAGSEVSRKVRYQVLDNVRRVVAVETIEALENMEKWPCP